MKSLYYILNKRNFVTNKNGQQKKYFIISVIACNDKKLTGEKSYDKGVDEDIYNKVDVNFVYQIYFDLDGKIENIIEQILGTVKVQLDAGIDTNCD